MYRTSIPPKIIPASEFEVTCKNAKIASITLFQTSTREDVRTFAEMEKRDKEGNGENRRKREEKL